MTCIHVIRYTNAITLFLRLKQSECVASLQPFYCINYASSRRNKTKMHPNNKHTNRQSNNRKFFTFTTLYNVNGLYRPHHFSYLIIYLFEKEKRICVYFLFRTKMASSYRCYTEYLTLYILWAVGL